MLSDIIFSFFKEKMPWYLIPLLWALLDYIFNIVMCFITGGIQNLLIVRKRRSKDFSRLFLQGARERLLEFRLDKLSWLWPLTILAFSIFFYYFSIQYLTRLYSEIGHKIAPLEIYTPKIVKEYRQSIQNFVILLSYIIALSTFFRYSKQRSDPTWFSRSKIFHLLRVLIFNANIAYSILWGFILWGVYFYSVYLLLVDEQITYNFIAPDLMYGLQPIYQSLIYYFFISLLLSFLPFIMVIREEGQKYEGVYYWLISTGLLIVLGSSIYLLIVLHLRIKSIFQDLLTLLSSFYEIEPSAQFSQDYLRKSIILSALLKDVPRNLPLPQWIYYFAGVRSLILLYELLSFVETTNKRPTVIFSLLKRIRVILKKTLSFLREK